MAQSALELLAWSTFVRPGLVAPSEFKSWSAAIRIRKLLKRAKLSVSIPAPLTTLSSLPGVSAPKDGPEAAAFVRNRIVHPPRNRSARKLTSPELVDAWRLMLRYTELLILKLASYSGNVKSRVDDQVGSVPWK